MEKTATFKEVNASGWKEAGSRWGTGWDEFSDKRGDGGNICPNVITLTEKVNLHIRKLLRLCGTL